MRIIIEDLTAKETADLVVEVRDRLNAVDWDTLKETCKGHSSFWSKTPRTESGTAKVAQTIAQPSEDRA